jgi:hypothetical protein
LPITLEAGAHTGFTHQLVEQRDVLGVTLAAAVCQAQSTNRSAESAHDREFIARELQIDRQQASPG